MMFTCAPLCANPAHGHARLRRTRKSATTKVVKSRRGKLVCVDLHCHYLNPAVHAKVVHLNPAQHEPAARFANALTREINVAQMRERAPKAHRPSTSGWTTWTAWASTSRRSHLRPISAATGPSRISAPNSRAW